MHAWISNCRRKQLFDSTKHMRPFSQRLWQCRTAVLSSVGFVRQGLSSFCLFALEEGDKRLLRRELGLWCILGHFGNGGGTQGSAQSYFLLHETKAVRAGVVITHSNLSI